MKILLSFLLSVLFLIHARAEGLNSPMFEFYENLDWNFFADKMEAEFDICSCEIEGSNQTPVGFKMRFVEPIMGVSVSNTPWNIVGMGIRMDESLWRKQGHSRGDLKDDFGFKHINAVIFPILGWTIGMAQDYICFERGTFLNMAYFSEVDPLYNNDVMGLIGEGAKPLSRLWFSNPIAEIGCAIDCAVTTTTGRPMNSLYYCNGCRGSASAADTGYTRRGMNIENSEMLLFRLISKMHAYGGLVKTADVSFTQNPTGSNIRSARCEARYFPTIVKEQYFAQLPNNDAHPLGKMRFHFDFKSKPNDEDDVFFWLWRMNDTCVGATKCRSTFTGM